jgi:hypothetical protein
MSLPQHPPIKIRLYQNWDSEQRYSPPVDFISPAAVFIIVQTRGFRETITRDTGSESRDWKGWLAGNQGATEGSRYENGNMKSGVWGLE